MSWLNCAITLNNNVINSSDPLGLVIFFKVARKNFVFSLSEVFMTEYLVIV